MILEIEASNLWFSWLWSNFGEINVDINMYLRAGTVYKIIRKAASGVKDELFLKLELRLNAI